MPFQVSRISGAPQFDSLPVAVLTHYPLEKRDYKPYAQSILCTDGHSLILRMWAFEVSPMPESELRCVLYLFPERPDTALALSMRADGLVGCALVKGGVEVPSPGRREGDITAAPFSGEDLQGVYWGAAVKVQIDFLRELGGKTALNAGDAFRGNFFKLCAREPFAHKGSFFPADFKAPYGSGSMGDFIVVAY